MYKLWNILLYAYVRCGLTKASDKFVALAGITTRAHQTLKDEYVAGLWRSYLMYDLLWQVEDVRVGIARPDVHRAPSWSWASVEGALMLGGQVPLYERTRLACTILGFSSIAASSNPFGPVKAARLRIRAQLKKVSITHMLLNMTPAEWHLLAHSGLNCGIKINGQWIKSMITVFDDAPHAPPTEDLYCFCVREEEQEEDDYYLEDPENGEAIAAGEEGEPHFIPFHFGLIIAPTGHRHGEYRRLAYYSLDGDEVLGIWHDAIDTNEGNWPCEEFDGRNKLHTVTLI